MEVTQYTQPVRNNQGRITLSHRHLMNPGNAKWNPEFLIMKNSNLCFNLPYS